MSKQSVEGATRFFLTAYNKMPEDRNEEEIVKQKRIRILRFGKFSTYPHCKHSKNYVLKSWTTSDSLWDYISRNTASLNWRGWREDKMKAVGLLIWQNRKIVLFGC